MSEVQTINSFLELLERSKLLSAAQIKKAINHFDLGKYKTPREVAARLVKERVITPFQADRLLEGRYRGFIIDRYRVREILGVGGMGSIFIAEDTKSREKVALKILGSEHETDAGMLARLRLEARAGMLLDHPNIVKTYRLDNTGAVTFMVMELVRGVSLHELVALNGAVTTNMACSIIRQAALGLHAGHEQGIIHRDVKPANFLIAKDGTTKILDYGLALVEDDADAEFSLAMIFGHDCLGTPDYISPEQSLDSGKVDCTTDIYSLGGTFYLTLTGKLPFPQKTTPAKLEAHRTLPPKNIRQHLPDLPEKLAHIVHRMLAKNPKKRFQSAIEVADALEPFAVQRALNFDFRQIVTLRARQAKAKRVGRAARSAGKSSSNITGSSGLLGRSSSGLAAEIDTQVNRADTPAVVDAQKRREKPAPIPSGSKPTTAVQAAAIPVPAGWMIRPLDGKAAVLLRKSKIVIGRAESCDVPVEARGISSQHCELAYDAGFWSIRDLGSRNGTFVNGSKIDSWILNVGDEVRLGENTGFVLDDGTGKKSGAGGAWVPFVIVGLVALLLIFVLFYFFGPG